MINLVSLISGRERSQSSSILLQKVLHRSLTKESLQLSWLYCSPCIWMCSEAVSVKQA